MKFGIVYSKNTGRIRSMVVPENEKEQHILGLVKLLNGVIRADANFPALTIGAAVYASTTGDIVVTQPSTADYIIRLIGYGLTADSIYFNPENDWITHV